MKTLYHTFPIYSNFSPNSDPIKATAVRAVLFLSSNIGSTSTNSADVMSSDSSSISIARWLSLYVRPPNTGVPTPGASSGSRQSKSKLTWTPSACFANSLSFPPSPLSCRSDRFHASYILLSQFMNQLFFPSSSELAPIMYMFRLYFWLVISEIDQPFVADPRLMQAACHGYCLRETFLLYLNRHGHRTR